MSHNLPTNRALIVQNLLRLWSEARNGRYFAHRGAINWTGFPFDKHPFAAAILVDESPLLVDNGDLRISIEVFTKLKDPTQQGIDDLTLDDLFEDCQNVLASLKKITRPDGELLVIGILPFPALEAHDVDNRGIEGIIARVTVRF